MDNYKVISTRNEIEKYLHKYETPERFKQIKKKSDNPNTSQEFRMMANRYYAQQDYDSAQTLYSIALSSLRKEIYHERRNSESYQTDKHMIQNKYNGECITNLEIESIYLSNRASCFFKMKLYDNSQKDAEDSLRISRGKNLKAYFHLARTQLVLGKYNNAISTINSALDNISKSKKRNDHDLYFQNNDTNDLSIENQRMEFIKLLIATRTKILEKDHIPGAINLAKVCSIKSEPRQPSIREFYLESELGLGNFSRVVICQHKVTQERFALKIVEKKKAEQISKRQHPNVYNEIKMERRVLGYRLSSLFGRFNGHRRIIKMYHSFQDYNSFYLLLDLHMNGGDLWDMSKYKEKLVGIHSSLVRIYLLEILDALEHIHKNGIVHRDLKPENILLSDRGHVILIDFGTTKDLILRDLNGPEFVGTPDFMAPEAVIGTLDVKESYKCVGMDTRSGSDHTLDLWAFGAVAFFLSTGLTPFNSISPYMTFLRIQRGNLRRPIGIPDDDAWDLIRKLMQVDRKTRLGANCYQCIEGRTDAGNYILNTDKGYETIRNHPYFSNVQQLQSYSGDCKEEDVPLPSLSDFCIRACAEMIQNDSLDPDIDLKYQPGDYSCHDMLRLKMLDRLRLMHLLERLCLLREPNIYRRFFNTKLASRLCKIRSSARDYMGLTQINDKQRQYLLKDTKHETQVIDSTICITQIIFMHVSNPLFVEEVNRGCTDDQRKKWILKLKDSLKLVNRTRPKVLIVSGYIDETCRKILGKVNETIPVILNDGYFFYSFWICGAQGFILSSFDFTNKSVNYNHHVKKTEQMIWLREELEQSRVAQHHTFAFVDCDPDELPNWLLNNLAKGNTLCLYGVSKGPYVQKFYRYALSNTKDKVKNGVNVDIDVSSISSSDTESNMNASKMNIIQRGDSSVHSVTLEDNGKWRLEILEGNSNSA